MDELDNIETLEYTNAQQILSCSTSLTRKLILITTNTGLLIVYVNKPTKFKRYLPLIQVLKQRVPIFCKREATEWCEIGFYFRVEAVSGCST